MGEDVDGNWATVVIRAALSTPGHPSVTAALRPRLTTSCSDRPNHLSVVGRLSSWRRWPSFALILRSSRAGRGEARLHGCSDWRMGGRRQRRSYYYIVFYTTITRQRGRIEEREGGGKRNRHLRNYSFTHRIPLCVGRVHTIISINLLSLFSPIVSFAIGFRSVTLPTIYATVKFFER